MEAQGADCKYGDAHNEQCENLRPQDIQADSFEEYAPQDDYVIPQRIENCNVLDERGHILDGEDEAGEQVGGQEEQKS